jgi:cell wall-associated NlpC family hydrolase
MRIRPIILALVLLCSGFDPVHAQGAVPASTGNVAIVTVPVANVRQEPLPKSTIKTQVLLAETVRVLEKQDERYRIAIPDQGGIEGWVNSAALLIPRDHGTAYFTPGRDWVVVSSPKTRALILNAQGDHALSLYAGTRLPVIDRSSSGYRVQFPDRRTVAVIPAPDVLPVIQRSPFTAAAEPAALAATARTFVGVRQFSGGVTEQGMDTRGLIYIIFRVHGMDLDMDRKALMAAAMPVPKQDLLPGDVLVFHGEGLGLYLGDGRFLHSPGKGPVQVSGIRDRRYANAFQTGLRLLGPDPQQRKRPAEMTADEIMVTQDYAATLPIGPRIAYWAGRFIGTPYDTDPLGLYVRTNRIVADEAADCMYLTFRAVELAKSTTPGEAIDQALQRRFFTEGKVTDGLVQNYAERFEYGEDMVFSGKWGRNITDELGASTTISGSRGRAQVIILPKSALSTRALQRRLQDGDIIFWVKDPKKRVVEEIVAHLAFIRVKNGAPYLIHASGSKNKWGTPNGGMVKEVPFVDYLRDSKFIGAFITRFEE